ncbi:hypothetical protein SNEBB_004034 [Seison nebaliae]|nr:hypothetical protein SNEBB_004034 [Seison nebaliae]
MSVVIESSIGCMTIDLLVDEEAKAVKNFLGLCRTKYYNFTIFNNVQRNFLCQVGANKNRQWTMGESYQQVNEIYYVSLVNVGQNQFGSQFFISLDRDGDRLDDMNHRVIGHVVEEEDDHSKTSKSMEVLSSINDVFCDKNGRPLQDIMIYHIVVIQDPFQWTDDEHKRFGRKSPPPTISDVENGMICVDENDNLLEGKNDEELEQIKQVKEEKAHGTLLEIMGDLPYADIKPPENILFVCKLNSITDEDDLEIIFSKYGRIISCNIIKDENSGNSLGYGFIEYDKKEDCERAYFKMNNSLIDDRRIHVDFSQSIAPVKWKMFKRQRRAKLEGEHERKRRRKPEKFTKKWNLRNHSSKMRRKEE